MSKIYNFTVPVSGLEHFSVEANSYEEALGKIDNSDYFTEPDLDDISWDFGFRDISEALCKCYVVTKGEEIE